VIVGAAVCPGAPFLIEGVADKIASRLAPIRSACRLAVSGMSGADVVLLISSGGSGPTAVASGIHASIPAIRSTAGAGSWRVLPPGAVVPSTSVRRSDLPGSPSVSLSTGPDAPGSNPGTGPTVEDPAVGTIVAANLLASASITTAATVVELVGDPSAAAAMLSGQASSTERVGVLVVADGSGCHGDDAPGKRDDRAASFDAAVAAALAAGDPARLALACADRPLARDLLANVDPLAVLASLTAGRPPTVAELLYSAAPLGVGYFVATWRWTDS
jgi:hypothetical protein